MSDARARLAAAQADLLASLLGDAPPPPGFDAGALRAAGDALRCKRAREVAQAWPRLAAALPDFTARFAAFARGHALEAGGPHDDGQRFARWLRDQGALPDEGLVDLLGVEVRRRPFAVRAARLARGGLFVAARLPWLGARGWMLGK
jgi:hypothetical protein